MVDSAISVKNLKKYYQVHQKDPGLSGSIKSLFRRKYYDVKAVDGISIEIKKGELIGFIGPNGAGKTTTLKVLSGLLYPTSGEVRVLGYEPFKRQAEFQKKFSLIMGQKNQLWWDLPAMESFLLFKEIYDIESKRFDQVLDQLSEILEVKDFLKIQVRKLSLGQRMKCELIAALLHSPQVLLLDEPTIGLDVVAQKSMRDFIKDYNKTFDSTIILTSHYMADVKELCKRVVIINHGRILYDGKLEKIINKFAPYKVFKIDFEKPIKKDEFEKYGSIEEYGLMHVKLKIAKKEVAEKAGKLLSTYQVTDLTIEDPEIEDIIREIFETQKDS